MSTAQPQQNTQPNVTIEIQRFYAKEQSCKVPHGYQAFQSLEKLETQIEMNINTQPIAQDIFETTLNVTVTGKIEQRTAYIANVQQSCVIKTNSKNEQQLNQIVNVHIPNMLYPYVRKTIADLIGCSGFVPVFLAMLDFGSVHQQQTQEEEKNKNDLQKLSEQEAA